ncbi:MAG: cohesin domain-containing protein [Minisyncoccota bacterium]
MNRFSSALFVALALVLPGAALAASVNLSPTTVSVTPGKVFTVTLTAEPVGAHLYTVRANVSFDPALVTVTDFTFAPKWLALSTSGYDSIDNTNGMLVKTAGYPGGITAPTVFGTVTFRAKAAGTAHITVTGQSMLLDENSKNTISGTQGAAQVVISAPAQVKTTPVVKKTTVKSTTKLAATVKPAVATSSESETVATTSIALATSTIATTSALAAAGAAGFSFGSPLGILLILLALAIIAGGTWYYRRRMN